MKRKRRTTIAPGGRVPVTFSERERLLVVDHTFAHPDLTERLRNAHPHRRRYKVQYTLDEIEELAGFVAAEANHTNSKRDQKELDALHERLHAEMESYEDGLWADSDSPSAELDGLPRPQLRVIEGAKGEPKG